MTEDKSTDRSTLQRYIKKEVNGVKTVRYSGTAEVDLHRGGAAEKEFADLIKKADFFLCLSPRKCHELAFAMSETNIPVKDNWTLAGRVCRKHVSVSQQMLTYLV